MDFPAMPAPPLELDCWVQGEEPELDQLAGQVVLIEVIQVNCPGCFVHGLPEAIRLHETYAGQGLKVFTVATAFEHFEHNTLENLQRLVQHNEVQGDPLLQLEKAGYLDNGKLPYHIPFSVAMDKLVPCQQEVTAETVLDFILSQVPDFHQNDWDQDKKQGIFQQAEHYLKSRTHHAMTFERYQLQGTPSTILIDRKGMLRGVSFGMNPRLETSIQELLRE